MGGWFHFEIPDAGVLVALVAPLAPILSRWSAAERLDIEILLPGSDKKAAERERALQAASDRSDTKFEALLARSNEPAKGPTGIA